MVMTRDSFSGLNPNPYTSDDNKPFRAFSSDKAVAHVPWIYSPYRPRSLCSKIRWFTRTYHSDGDGRSPVSEWEAYKTAWSLGSCLAHFDFSHFLLAKSSTMGDLTVRELERN